MAYSRWSGSTWYSYWVADTEAISISYSIDQHAHYEFDWLITVGVSELLDKLREDFPEATEDELREVVRYITEFVMDVLEERRANGRRE